MTEGVIPSLHVYSKNTPLKQYHKTCGRGAGLRTETTINNTYDFGVGRLWVTCLHDQRRRNSRIGRPAHPCAKR